MVMREEWAYKRVYVINQSWTGEHDSVDVWWSHDSQNPATRQKRPKQTLEHLNQEKKESEKVLRESEKGERHGTDLTIK